LHAVDPDRFDPMPVYIDQSLRWWTGDDLWHTEAFKGGGPDRSRLTEVSLSPGFGSSMLIPVAPAIGDALSGQSHAIRVDVFVPVLHGTFGEDGALQGLLDLGGCAYVGCGVLASAVGMNKRMTKIVASHHGVPVVPWVSCERSVLDRGSAWLKDLPAQVEHTLRWPVIVKLERRCVDRAECRRVDCGCAEGVRVRRRSAHRTVHHASSGNQRGRLRSRGAGRVGDGNARDESELDSVVQRKVQAAGEEERRLE
jgi:hypothetical protein